MSTGFGIWRARYGEARFMLFAVFTVFFTFNFLMVVYGWQKYYSDDKQMIDLLKQIAAIYSVQFGVILGGIFAMRSVKEDREPCRVFPVALVLVLLWNINVTWPLLYLVTKAGPQNMDIGWHLKYWQTVPELTSFLCTTALTFFFVRREQESTEAAAKRERDASTKSSAT